MNKISIETLFPSEDSNKSYSNGKINIDTLFSNNKNNDNQDRNFDSDSLIKNIVEKRKRIRKWYVNMYNICCRDIKEADQLKMKDMIYVLPDIIPECPEFDHADCIRYISQHLRLEGLDTHVINKRKIFITWINIEYNKISMKKSKNDNKD